ncbi:NDP-hexose 2,3-dehydratase family protein [Micromonospora tulbaghiae]|uniref:Oxidase EvaA n=1 Tax=Micromonospora tulbaghiae TaxID=479978 RepID=A0ABY0KHL7_9ACTN|nr:NDP-hexose 2,3-dehydratase family protein [Micromonospora tulbaghiae]MDX5459255.1 NDP-hexose 2,3-dehydratase family protein [Micromonospora tulbaghiae]SCE73453.1 oxidase EvaA [Micromonospora tulbaghiae]
MSRSKQILAERADADRLVMSALATDSAVTPTAQVLPWLAERSRAHSFEVRRVPLGELTGWQEEPGTGNLVHHTGRFFSIEGLRVQTERTWTQPIIVQPEVGVLGLLMKEFDGVLHCLMHAKMEPGNAPLVQLSPTVQATRSNYTGVHRGTPIRYFEYMRPSARSRVLVDVLQSEQNSWFLHKRNRNMVVETTDDVPVGDDFRWLTLGQLAALLRRPDVVNMDTRSVMSCIPATPSAVLRPVVAVPGDTFAGAVRRSFWDDGDARHTQTELLGWLTRQRAVREVRQRRVPLSEAEADGWRRDDDEIAHVSGKYFTVIGVSVLAGSREVRSWQQPLLAPVAPGVLALLVKRIAGVLHGLVQARADAGSLTGVELGPTVQCQPVNYRDLPPRERPRYLDLVPAPGEARIRYDVVQSEEGGRFHHARNRYLVVEVGDEFPVEAPDDFRWMTMGQLAGLLSHGNYLNVELRSLLACARTLW